MSNPDQVKTFGRKIRFCVISAFSKIFINPKYVQLYIQSIPPEWTSLGKLIPAQHLIKVSIHLNFKPKLISFHKEPWIYKQPIQQQILNTCANKIAWNIFQVWPPYKCNIIRS